MRAVVMLASSMNSSTSWLASFCGIAQVRSGMDGTGEDGVGRGRGARGEQGDERRRAGTATPQHRQHSARSAPARTRHSRLGCPGRPAGSRGGCCPDAMRWRVSESCTTCRAGRHVRGEGPGVALHAQHACMHNTAARRAAAWQAPTPTSGHVCPPLSSHGGAWPSSAAAARAAREVGRSAGRRSAGACVSWRRPSALRRQPPTPATSHATTPHAHPGSCPQSCSARPGRPACRRSA